MNFDFIADENFRVILKRDFEELNKCLESESSKSVLILAGSIIEAVLIDYFTNFPPNATTSNKVLTLDLSSLVDLAFESKLISSSTKDLSTVVRNYRNLIHPGREVRKKESFSFDSAIVAKSLVNIIISEIRENYITHVGYKAEDIIAKLENDSITQPIFEKIINKIHKNEKVKLYNLLIEYDMDLEVKQGKLTEPKKYLNILKSHVDREVIIKQLLYLSHKIETGQKWEVMTYFYLLYDDLGILDENNIELISLYVLNVLCESCKDVTELNSYVKKQLFGVIGKYLKTAEIVKEFIRLSTTIVWSLRDENDYIYFSAYDQLINSVSQKQKDMVKDHVLKSLSVYSTDKFYEGYRDGNFLPF
jgi:hypothetical protein